MQDSPQPRCLLPAQDGRQSGELYIYQIYLIEKFLTAIANRVATDTLTRIRFAPPCSLTAGLLERYYEFLGMDIRNADLYDPVERVLRPTNDVVMCATFKEVVTCGQDGMQ